MLFFCFFFLSFFLCQSSRSAETRMGKFTGRGRKGKPHTKTTFLFAWWGWWWWVVFLDLRVYISLSDENGKSTESSQEGRKANKKNHNKKRVCVRGGGGGGGGGWWWWWWWWWWWCGVFDLPFASFRLFLPKGWSTCRQSANTSSACLCHERPSFRHCGLPFDFDGPIFSPNVTSGSRRSSSRATSPIRPLTISAMM